jgi:hypothetical protein
MAMPVPILALVNGSVSRETAIVSHRNEDPEVAEAWRAPVIAFARKAASRSRQSSAGIWDYPSQQAKLCLGDLMERESRYGKGVRIWVPPGSRDVALRAVADEVIHAQSTPVPDAIEALGLLDCAYRASLPILSARGLAYSTARERQCVLSEMADAFREFA